MTEYAILYDSSLCTNCKGCQVACKCWNMQPSPIGLNENKFNGYQNPPDLNGHTRLVQTFNEAEDPTTQKGVRWAFGRRSCQHCGDAPCAAVCPSGALHKDEETGMVTIIEGKCIGCKYCLSACPFNVPRFRERDGRINKCTGCPDRIEQGLAPACVSTCQPDALKFGPRDEMLAIAHERVEKLHERGYAEASVYGEHEVGGSHTIHVLKYGLDAYMLPKDPQTSPTVQMTRIMKPVTGAATGLTVVGLAAMFALGVGYRRDKLAYNPETGDTISRDTGKVVKHGDPQDDLTVAEHLSGVPVVGGLFKKGGKDE